MPAHNADVAAVFEEIADLLEIEGSNPFRIRAYRSAARTLRDLPHEVGAMLDEGEDLTELPGIGEDLAAKIKEIVETGTVSVLETLRKNVPKTLTELLRIPGVGPKRVKVLYRDLGIRTLDQLQKAAQDGRVRSIQGFGEKTERYILDQLKKRAGEEKRVQLAGATQYAETLVTYLKGSPGVKQVVVAGSYRRAKETIGDLDILVTADAGSPVMDRLLSYPEVKEILAHGTTKASVRLACKLQVDVRVVPEVSYGAALQYFTGSKAHSLVLRQLGQQLDLPDEDLRCLDLVVGAIHSHFRLSRQKQTDRILRAMNHPYFTILAHPTGRLINERTAYDVAMAQVIRHARERGCFLEVNAHPVRLDLTDSDCRSAKEEGVLLSINSDAHSVFDLDNLRYGIGQARRGWLEKEDVLNTRSLHLLRPLLKRTMVKS